MARIREVWRQRMERARDETDATLQGMLDAGMDPNDPVVRHVESVRDRAAAAVEELTTKAAPGDEG
ncbi:MAG: hypothetical protein INR70_15510 [Parafilimonas terrae]|nr:hypothetical protein [Parafilimonas terrae]